MSRNAIDPTWDPMHRRADRCHTVVANATVSVVVNVAASCTIRSQLRLKGSDVYTEISKFGFP